MEGEKIPQKSACNSKIVQQHVCAWIPFHLIIHRRLVATNNRLYVHKTITSQVYYKSMSVLKLEQT